MERPDIMLEVFGFIALVIMLMLDPLGNSRPRRYRDRRRYRRHV